METATESILERYVEADLQRVIENTLRNYREKYESLSEAERESLHNQQRDNSRKWLSKIFAMIENRNPSEVRNAFHHGNPTSREIFTEITGISLPRTESGTRESLRQWIGEKYWDDHFAELTRQEEQRISDRKEKERLKELSDLLSEKIRYHRPGGGVSIVGTFEEFIRLKLSEGFRPVDRKRGFSSGWVLRREETDRNGWQETQQFRGKIVRQWIDSILPEYTAATESV